ncbi:MAG TPA: hydantoinase B/oxoprolinase family protein [Candidatus Binatia bacterium]|nr:hydantoinase B/oxoprolinase family protein [Candidatus Binatia bacterium]
MTIVQSAIDPITSEVIKNSLIYASEEMGIAVRNASYSANIKERLDHSCALFDRRGRLIAQAEHIPVHLGSLPWGLQQTLESLKARGDVMRPGDMWVVNDPYLSGTHLNDITVIRPVFFQGNLIGYAGNKAHHADVGGAVPGSMSSDARELFVEGLIIPATRIMQSDQVVEQTVELIRANSRSPEMRSGDLKAQIAGNVTGERRMLELIERHGIATFEAAIERFLGESERRLRTVLRELREGTYIAEDFLEVPSGEPSICIRAMLTIKDGTIAIDYAGTNRQLELPINAVFGVTLSGVYYAVRAVTDSTIPMNDGCFRPVTVMIEPGTILSPIRPAPVSGGNVETSTRNAQVILQALAQAAPERVSAMSGGTMTNVMAGGTTKDGRHWTFYETNGCGMGARSTMDGIDGIQCDMTNTLNTPIEAIEQQFPLRVTRYEFVPGTGGGGRYRGGCGLVREIELVDGDATFVLLCERHTLHPPGAQGGKPGGSGRNVHAKDGIEYKIAGKATLRVCEGERIATYTPGGGGYGDPLKRDAEARRVDEKNGLVCS